MDPGSSSQRADAATMTREEFERYQHLRRRHLWSLLGHLPEHAHPRPAQVRHREKRNHYTLEHVLLDLNGLEDVPAVVLLPDKRPPRAPGVLYMHAHGGTYELGKEELWLGRKVMQPYAPVFAELGIVALAIDSWCFSERKHEEDGRLGEMDTFKLMLWRGQVLWGMMLYDEYQALSYLLSRPEVDPHRIGVFGLSMGATKAWWLAALDPRISLCIDLCCLTDYEELIRAKNLKGHSIYYYVPRLLKYFHAADINELIVPRRRLSLNGRQDPLTPPAGVEKIRRHVLPLYEKFGRREDCRIELFDCGHEETPEMRRLVREWLVRYLVQPG